MSSRTSHVSASHLIKHGPLTPEPGLMQAHPWRFTLGQSVYLAGRRQTMSYEVVGGELHRGFPHLHVRDIAGPILRVPQLCASSKPIPVK